jgi:hypothetical protein
MKVNRKMIGGLILLGFVLSACTGGAAPEPGDLVDAQAQREGASVEQPGTQSESPDELDADSASEPEVREPRQGLAATDPSTVVLASGEPQIVEFFAFW